MKSFVIVWNIKERRRPLLYERHMYLLGSSVLVSNERESEDVVACLWPDQWLSLISLELSSNKPIESLHAAVMSFPWWQGEGLISTQRWSDNWLLFPQGRWAHGDKSPVINHKYEITHLLASRWPKWLRPFVTRDQVFKYYDFRCRV